MRVLTKSRAALIQEGRKFLEDNTSLTNFSPGSVIRSILEVMANQVSEQYDIMNANLLQTYVSTATGTALDNIGTLFGLVRTQARRAQDTTHTNFRFYLDPTTGFTAGELASIQYAENIAAGITNNNVTATSFTIPRGTVVKNGAIEFSITEAVTLTDDETEAGVPIVAAGFGEGYNAPAYSITQYTLNSREFATIRLYLRCENKQSLSNGQFIEDDTHFRARVVGAHISAGKANETAIRLAALSIPGVSDVLVEEFSAGIGTFSLYVISDTPIPSDGLLNAVAQAVRFDKALGIEAIVTRPEYAGFEITIALDYLPTTQASEKTNIKSVVGKEAELYINNLGIGGEFIANELTSRVLGVSEKIRDMRVTRFVLGVFDSNSYVNKKTIPIFFANQKVKANQQPLAVPGKIIIC